MVHNFTGLCRNPHGNVDLNRIMQNYVEKCTAMQKYTPNLHNYGKFCMRRFSIAEMCIWKYRFAFVNLFLWILKPLSLMFVSNLTFFLVMQLVILQINLVLRIISSGWNTINQLEKVRNRRTNFSQTKFD